jgi:antitoxin component YwqK of YwqJK toxin-antitoxin module
MVFWVGKLDKWDASGTDGLNCKGYTGVGSDGEYIYYTPYYNGSAFHGVVLRQKIYAIFKQAGTWEAYNAGAVDSLTTTGFRGNPIFDGRFMYFVPYNNGSTSGIVLRYDTTKPFKSASSWEAYNAGATGGLTAKGFYGAVYDGKYIYFVPMHNGGYHGIFLRYDTTMSFKSASSWVAYDVGSMAGGAAKGYWGGVEVNGFIYFSPYYNGAYHGKLLRYGVSKPFADAGSWSVFDVTAVAANCKGFGAPSTDGRFVYFPNVAFNLILRYDTDLPFGSTSSYSTYDSTELSEDSDDHHNACCIQGHYVTFAPDRYTILIYDLEKPFNDSGSWAERDIYYVDRSFNYGFLGAYSDENYIYFAPSFKWDTYHGHILRVRVDPCPAQNLPAPGETEDLTEYMYYCEDDLSITTSRATALAIDSSCSSYVFKDYEKDFFDGFEIQFDVRITSITPFDDWWGGYTYISAWSLSNKHADLLAGIGENDPSVMYEVEWDDLGNIVALKLHLTKAMDLSASGLAVSVGTTYYCTVTRSDGSSTITLRIYADAARTSLLSTQSITTYSSTTKWRFIYAMRGMLDSDDIVTSLTYYVENLKIVSY